MPQAASFAVPRGVYPGPSPKQLLYWAGQAWDPRPVAGTWVRVGCYIADAVIALVIAMAAFSLVLAPFGLYSSTYDNEREPLAGATFGIMAVTFIAYFTCSYRWWGRTPGMMMGRLYVIGIDTGTKLTWGRALLRALLLALGNLCGFMTLIWLVTTASSVSKQGPHDSAAHSIVLRRFS